MQRNHLVEPKDELSPEVANEACPCPWGRPFASRASRWPAALLRMIQTCSGVSLGSLRPLEGTRARAVFPGDSRIGP